MIDLDIPSLVSRGFAYEALRCTSSDVDNKVFSSIDHLYVKSINLFPNTSSFPIKIDHIEEILDCLRIHNFYVWHVYSADQEHGNIVRTVYFRGIGPDDTTVVALSVALNHEYLKGDEDAWNNTHISILYTTQSSIIPMLEKFKYLKYLDNKDKGKVLIFEKNEYNELCLNPYAVKGYDISIEDNYNDDFKEVDSKLRDWLADFELKNNKLVLFNGPPGTGKTNYLKYILNNTPDVKKIYMPPYMVEAMADPAFLPILRREKNSLLIIEDAEKILKSRDSQESASVVSVLLNLCDGIMADSLNFKVIATFNTDEDQIDSALMRRGRMFMHYKFDFLNKKKAEALYHKIHNESITYNKQVSLSDIYNAENRFSKKAEKPKIGFL